MTFRTKDRKLTRHCTALDSPRFCDAAQSNMSRFGWRPTALPAGCRLVSSSSDSSVPKFRFFSRFPDPIGLRKLVIVEPLGPRGWESHSEVDLGALCIWGQERGPSLAANQAALRRFSKASPADPTPQRTLGVQFRETCKYTLLCSVIISERVRESLFVHAADWRIPCRVGSTSPRS